eukprot:g12491.t1
MECAKDYNVELPTASDIELANTNCQNRRYPNLQFPLAWGWCKFQKRHKDKDAWIFCEQCKVWVAVCHWDGDWRHWLSNEPNAFGACEHFQASEREKMSSLLLQRSQHSSFDVELQQAALAEAELAVDARKARVAHVGLENFNVKAFTEFLGVQMCRACVLLLRQGYDASISRCDACPSGLNPWPGDWWHSVPDALAIHLCPCTLAVCTAAGQSNCRN